MENNTNNLEIKKTSTIHRTFNIPHQKIIIVAWIVAILTFGSFTAIGIKAWKQPNLPTTEQTKIADKYVAFLNEVYDKIQANYWEKISDEELIKLYVLGSEKLEKKPEVTIINDKIGLLTMLNQIISTIEDETAKKEFTTNLASIVLYNLQPLARSGLYTTKKEKELWDTVKNIDPETNLYEEIDVPKDAPTEDIIKATEDKTTELQEVIKDPEQSAETKQTAEEKLAKVERAKETLVTPTFRETYNASGIEASVSGEIIDDTVLHMKIKKISPTAFSEFQQVAKQFDQYDSLNTLILDLRDNIGGSVDLLPYFLGPFIGQGQYAYELYHQGDYEPFKTQLGWLDSLVRYKRVIILQNANGQSSAETMAATLKKYNVGILVGVPSKGWGTIEAVFDIDNQISDDETYKMFLVHSITLRDDNQPIEGRGVDPLIDIRNEDWPEQLDDYINDKRLVKIVEDLVK